MPQRPQNGLSHPADPIRRSRPIGLSEPAIEPGDQVPAGDVSAEQEQAVGQLVQATIPEPMGWQRAGREMIGLGASA